VNVNLGTDDGEWCYVDSVCSSINGGSHTLEGVSWKKSQHRQDKMLRDYSPKELADLAMTTNLDLGLLHKMSYPLSKEPVRVLECVVDRCEQHTSGTPDAFRISEGA